MAKIITIKYLTMSFTFKETDALTKDRIAEGY
jgi:hypothetical protein